MEIKITKETLEEKNGKFEKVKKETTLKPKNKEKDIILEDKDFYLIQAVHELTKALRLLANRRSKWVT